MEPTVSLTMSLEDARFVRYEAWKAAGSWLRVLDDANAQPELRTLAEACLAQARRVAAVANRALELHATREVRRLVVEPRYDGLLPAPSEWGMRIIREALVEVA